eukprot:1302587-Prymnesium_polylepis.1
MQTVRSASCLSTWNAVHRATSITPPGAPCAMMSTASHSRAAVRLSAADRDPELERLNTLALVI